MKWQGVASSALPDYDFVGFPASNGAWHVKRREINTADISPMDNYLANMITILGAHAGSF